MTASLDKYAIDCARHDMRNALTLPGTAAGFIPASVKLADYPGMFDAAMRLCSALGATPGSAQVLRDTALISLYAISKNNPVAAQRRMFELLDKAGAAPAPTAPAAPQAPAATPYDDSALIAALAAMQSDIAQHKAVIERQAERINELENAAPRVIEVSVNAAPPVTFTRSHYQFERLLRYAVNRKHVWLCGPRGSGKSKAAEQVAQALGLPFYAVTGASDEFAFQGYERPFNGIVTTPQFREAWINGGVIVLDEMDTYNPAAIVYLNDALANGNCVFPDGRFPKHPDCVVIAGTNTNCQGATDEYSARSVIDGATLDRFAYIDWGYDRALENALGSNPQWTRYVQALRAEFERQSIPHAPSPRATIGGAEAIAMGDTWSEAADAYIWKGMADDIRQRLERAVPMDAYENNYQAANAA